MVFQQPKDAFTSTTMIGAIRPDEDLNDQGDWAADTAEAVAGLPAGSALLVVVRGPNLGARFLLKSPRVTAGRKPSADIFLDDVTVSRRHAEFIYQEGIWTVRDAGALNGTYVNGDLVDQSLLNSGDLVQIGKYRMLFYPSALEVGVTKVEQ